MSSRRRRAEIYIGCAGWSIPRDASGAFDTQGSHLERYATRFNAVEINSSFYRPHRPATYARWAASVPDGFRFSVKMPREITHDRRLVGVKELLAAFVGEIEALGGKLGCVLVQLPPSLAFDRRRANAFFRGLRQRHDGPVALEPRHPSWFVDDVGDLLERHAVARVVADPAKPAKADEPGGCSQLRYFRLHGSPRMYYSEYPEERLQTFAARLRAAAAGATQAWCIFDNTALGAATRNALDLRALLDPESVLPSRATPGRRR